MKDMHFFATKEPSVPVVKLQYALIIDTFMPYLDGLEKILSMSEPFEIHLDCVGSTGFYGDALDHSQFNFVDPCIETEVYTTLYTSLDEFDSYVKELKFHPKKAQDFYCSYMKPQRKLAQLTAFFNVYDQQKITIKSFFKEEISNFKTFIETLRPLISNKTITNEVTEPDSRRMHSNYFLLLDAFPCMIPELKWLIVQTGIDFEIDTLIKNAKMTNELYFNDIRQAESELYFEKQKNDLALLPLLDNNNLCNAFKIFVIYTILTSRYQVLEIRNDMKTALKLTYESALLIEFVAENFITKNGFTCLDEAREQLINISMDTTESNDEEKKYHLETIDDNSLVSHLHFEIADYHRRKIDLLPLDMSS